MTKGNELNCFPPVLRETWRSGKSVRPKQHLTSTTGPLRPACSRPDRSRVGDNAMTALKCSLCDDSGWVCESHPQEPWDGSHACGCGGSGTPCQLQADRGLDPALPF